MMASLRSRLLAALLIVTAVGLLLLGGITYLGQRSFQLDRLDEQIRRAPPGAAGALDGRDFERGGPRRGGDGGPPPDGGRGAGLPPPGTYVERRDADGDIEASEVFGYGQDIRADPALPAEIPVGRPFTVDGENGDDTRYRVYAELDRLGSGLIVVAAPLSEVDATLNRLLLLELLVIAGVLVMVGVVGWALVRVGLQPLDRIGHTASAIAGGDLSHRVASTDPRTEVGRLGIAFNAMLDRLEGAFGHQRASEDRLRRFLADASHELRTPLASIRGYAELFRMGAASSPEDVGKAMGRIEDEAARMGVLVEDLLTLARLDEIAEAPHTDVDLGALAADAVEDARVTAPERDISVAVDGEARVLGDAHQLRQVLGNLLRNALVHTPAGTPIEVAVRSSGGGPGDGVLAAVRGPGSGQQDGVLLEIRDHGPGLPPGDPSALFERFWRAEAGRERGKAGAGLGLAIVAAIVEAHGGRVSAADASTGGAVFSVVLPRAGGVRDERSRAVAR